MRFGTFLPPLHKVGTNPNLALHRDLALLEHLDRLGFDEAWVGEHHSSGTELIASPELFLAAAAQRTERIRLGTGVVSLPYHHPFQVADRVVLLDHITRGRAMFGAGPGQLATDAVMLGVEPSLLRPRMEEALDVILRLLRGETVTRKTDWFTCDDAVLQLAPHGDLEVCVTATMSPSGPKLAGRHGAGMLSLAATDPKGTSVLASHWEILEAEAAAHDHEACRDAWRLVGPMHVAETVDQAKQECRYGLEWVYDYLRHVTPTALPPCDSSDELADLINDTGRGVIGTPDMAVEQIRRLEEASGGFGCYLLFGVDFAPWDATLRSYSLFAQEVAPHFTGQLDPVMASYREVVATGDRNVAATRAGQDQAARKYAEEKARGTGR